MSLKYNMILSLVWLCFSFPSDALGQYILKETVNKKTYAVIYSDGLAKSAQWSLGMKMMKNNATIRHQVSKGNGGNLSVNDKIPVRFIIAPTDVENVSWLQAGGVDGGVGNLNADFTATQNTGCRNYGSTSQGAGRVWRVPTQRELQLMWVFRRPIGFIYPDAPMESAGSSTAKNYWAATEQDAGNAWTFDFKQGIPACFSQPKTTPGYVRCVSDY